MSTSSPRPSTPRSSAGARVHVWLPSLGEAKGGIQTFSKAFVASLIEHLGHQRVCVYVKNDRHPPAGMQSECHVYGWIGLRPLRTLVYTLALFFAAWRDRPGLIIAGHANFSRLATWLHRQLKIPFWAIMYGLEVWGGNGAVVASALLDADELFAISRFTRDHFASEQGVDPTPIKLLPVTFDAERFQPGPKKQALLDRLGLDSEKKIILTVCRLAEAERYKGYDQIVAAMPGILQAVPEAHYLIAGQGKDADRLRGRIAELGVEKHVTLAGFVPDEELCDFYNLCDVFAMPSKLEGFGIVYLEALSCGKPVLAGNVDGSVDAVLDGELGVLVNPDSTEDVTNSLIEILTKRHSHPLIYEPEELRRRAIDAYGPARFSTTLGRYIQDFLHQPH